MAAQPDYSLPKGRYIEVVLICGRDLPKMDLIGSCDPYATISLGEKNENVLGSTKSFKSSIKKNTLNPVWNEAFIFKDEGDKDLVIKLYDEDSRSDELIAKVTIPTADIGDNERKEGQWFPLTTKKNKPAGDLCMKIERFLDFRELKDRAKAFREQMENLQDENEALLEKAKQRDGLKRQVDDLLTEVDSASKKYTAMSNENEDLTGQKADLESQLSEVRDLLDAANGELEIAKAAASDDAVHDAAVQKRVDELTQKYRSASQQRTEASTRADKLQKLLNQAQAEVDTQNRRKDQLDQKYNYLDEAHKKTRSQLEKLRKEHRVLQRQYEEVSVPAVVSGGASQSASGGGSAGGPRPGYNTYGEFLTGLGLVFVLFLHRSQNLE